MKTPCLYLIRRMGRLCGLLATCVPFGMAMSQRTTPSAVPHAAHQAAYHASRHAESVVLSAETVQRVEQFLDELASTMPTLLRDGDVSQFQVDQKHTYDSTTRVLERFGGVATAGDPHDRNAPSQNPAALLAKLDSIRAVWVQTDAPVRARWFTQGVDVGGSGLQVVASTLTGIVPSGTIVESATRFADALLHTDAVATGAAADTIIQHPASAYTQFQRTEVSDILHRTGMTLSATIQLTHGDTAAAMATFHRTMRAGDELGLRAALLLEQLATARHDTATRAEVLGLLMMKLGGMPALKRADHKTFVALYPAWRRHNPQLPADPERYLDNLFQELFDRGIAVTRYTEAHSRLVVWEYLTGLHCGICWEHDRIVAALLQRYPAEAFVPLAYEFDCPPLSNEIESPQTRLSVWNGGYPNSVRFGAIPQEELTGKMENGRFKPAVRSGDPWINGLPSLTPEPGSPQQSYESYVAQIDQALTLPPGAVLAMRVTHQGDQVDVRLIVDSVRAPSHRLAARIVLVEDTVRVMGATNRRLQYGVIRAVAHSPGLLLGIPLTGPAGGRQTAQYHFDLAAITAQLQSQRSTLAILRQRMSADSAKAQMDEFGDRWPDLLTNYPDPSDWRMNRNRLHVIALVQDLDTGEILQATRVSLAPSAGAANRSAHL